MNHVPAITSEAGEYGDNGITSVIRSTRRFWVAQCSCGWHAGSGIGLSWFDTKREAKAAWQDHVTPGDTVGGKDEMKLCGEQLEQCACTRLDDHAPDLGHKCGKCGAAWADDGTPIELPPEEHEHAWQIGVVGQRT